MTDTGEPRPTSWPDEQWPTAELGRIARLRTLSAGLSGTVVQETVLDAPLEEAWRAITDFERSVPAADADVARLRIVRRTGDPETGEQLRFVTRQTARMLWLPAVIDVDLSPGWCWMVTRPQLYVVGMAAEPAGDRTRFAHLEGLAVSTPSWLGTLLRPLLAASRWYHRRHIPHDLVGFKRFVNAELNPDDPDG
jgi:hypothetical protein